MAVGGCSRTSLSSWPVTGFGSILPATLIRIPRSGSFATMYSASSDPPGGRVRGTGCHTVWRYRPRRRSFRPAAAFRFRSSRSSIPAGTLRPAARSSSPRRTAAGVHAPRPEPADGLIVKPSGSVTCRVLQVRGRERIRVFPRSAARPARPPAPSGIPRSASSGCTSIDGSKGTRSHPSIGPTSATALDHASAASHESALIVAVSGLGVHAVGIDRNGLGVMFDRLDYHGRTLLPSIPHHAVHREPGTRGHPRS